MDAQTDLPSPVCTTEQFFFEASEAEPRSAAVARAERACRSLRRRVSSDRRRPSTPTGHEGDLARRASADVPRVECQNVDVSRSRQNLSAPNGDVRSRRARGARHPSACVAHGMAWRVQPTPVSRCGRSLCVTERRRRPLRAGVGSPRPLSVADGGGCTLQQLLAEAARMDRSGLWPELRHRQPPPASGSGTSLASRSRAPEASVAICAFSSSMPGKRRSSRSRLIRCTRSVAP